MKHLLNFNPSSLMWCAIFVIAACSGAYSGTRCHAEYTVFLVKPTPIKLGKDTLEELSNEDMGRPFIVWGEKGDWLAVSSPKSSGWIYRKHTVPLDEAVNFFTGKIGEDARNAGYYRGRGLAYRQIGELDKAQQDLTQVITLVPRWPIPYLERCEVYILLENWEEAILDCNKVLQLQAQGKQDHFNLIQIARYLHGFASEHLGNVAHAYSDYDTVIECRPKGSTDSIFVNAHIRRGILRRDASDFDMALEDFTAAMKLNPQRGLTYVERGLCYLRLAKWKEAREDFQRAIELFPDQAFLLLSVSGQMYAMNSQDLGVRQELDPSRSAYFNLVMLLLTCPDEEVRDPQQALALAKKLRSLDDGRYFHFVAAEAAAYAAVGKFEEAVDLQKQTLELSPPPFQKQMRARLNLYENRTPYRPTNPEEVEVRKVQYEQALGSADAVMRLG